MVNRLMLNISSNPTRCPICGDAEDHYGRRGYYFKCLKCKVCFRPQRESAAELEEYWQEAFWTEEEIEKRKEREPVFRHALEVLLRHKPEARSVLDIGCGIGTFLAVCREEGLSVTGVEPSSIACEVAKREYGLELINEPFSSRILQGRKFDAIFAAQILHHLKDPAAFAADVDRVLADDGILMLRTPNLIAQESILFLQRLLGREKGFFCGPALYVFHPYTLTLLLRGLGYRDVRFVNSRPYLEGRANPGHSKPSFTATLKRLSLAALKLATYGFVILVYRVSDGRAVIGPSIFVVARKNTSQSGRSLSGHMSNAAFAPIEPGRM